MSTKSSIQWGDDFHLYHDLAEGNDVICLRLDHADFEATKDSVTINIPVAVWEAIRHSSAVTLDLVGKTDDELWADVGEKVRERIATVKALRKDGKRGPIEFFAVAGAWVYGAADDPVDVQLQRGFKYFSERRAQQEDIQRQIDRYREGMARPTRVDPVAEEGALPPED